MEAKDLNEKLIALEAQIKVYEEQARESSAVSETSKIELEEALLKLKQLEIIVMELQTKLTQFEEKSRKLAEPIVKFIEEVSIYETKVSDLEGILSKPIIEKDETVKQLHQAEKTITVNTAAFF